MPLVPVTAFRWHVVALVVFVAVAAAARLHNLTQSGLWMDELWAATYVQLDLKDLLVAIARFDVHPPVWYLQLNAWSALFGRDDAALLANSVAWSLLGIVITWFAASTILSPGVGLLAAALMAVAGSEVYYGQELRMYAMISALVPLAWLLAERFARMRRLSAALWLLAVLAPLGLAHGASVVPISCVVVYLVLRLGIRESLRPRNIALFAACGVGALPAALNAMFRGVSHTQMPGVRGVAETVAGWLFGYFPLPHATMAVAGALLVGAAIASALREPTMRRVALAFILWPLVFVLAVSLVRPIWIARLMAFCAPFACIALAASLAHIWSWRRSPAMAIGVGLVAVMAVSASGQAGDGRKMEYREAAEFLRENVRPDELVLLPEHVAFWGVARYFAGPDWGNLLKIQDPVRPSESRAWDGIYARLGADWLRWLKLIPERRVIEAHGVRLMIGHTADPAMRTAPRLWIIGSGRVQPEDLDICPVDGHGLTYFRGITVHAWTCYPAR